MRLDHLERPQSVLALQKALMGQKEPGHRGEGSLMDQIKDLLARFRRRPDGDADKALAKGEAQQK